MMIKTIKLSRSARVALISDSVNGEMLTSTHAITQANRTSILDDSLFTICCPRILNLIWQSKLVWA